MRNDFAKGSLAICRSRVCKAAGLCVIIPQEPWTRPNLLVGTQVTRVIQSLRLKSLQKSLIRPNLEVFGGRETVALVKSFTAKNEAFKNS